MSGTARRDDRTPRQPQVGDGQIREEFKGMTVTRIPAEDPEVVRVRDDARLDGIGRGTDPVAYLGEEDDA